MQDKIVLNLEKITDYKFSVIQINDKLYINEKDLININQLKEKGFNNLADSLGALGIYRIEETDNDNKKIVSNEYSSYSNNGTSKNLENDIESIFFMISLLVVATILLFSLFFFKLQE